ncbi:unnamed protein product, partial [Prunus brigantina]
QVIDALILPLLAEEVLHPRQPFFPVRGQGWPLGLRPGDIPILEVPPIKGREIHQVVPQMDRQPLWHSSFHRGAKDAGIGGSTVIISPGRNNARKNRALDFSVDVFKLSLKDLGQSFNGGRSAGGH